MRRRNGGSAFIDVSELDSRTEDSGTAITRPRPDSENVQGCAPNLRLLFYVQLQLQFVQFLAPSTSQYLTSFIASAIHGE